MNYEKEKKYVIDVALCDFDENGLLKPYGYQNLANTLIDKHLSTTSIGVGEKLTGSLAWVLVSLSLEVKRPLKLHESFYGRTWHVSRRGPFFRRDFEILDDNNELVFHGTTFTVLLDLTNRTIYMKSELPFEILPDNAETTIEASPNFNARCDFVEVFDRNVGNSYIDPLKHVNNSKYGEIAYDALAREDAIKNDKLHRIDVYFHSEMSLGDHFVVAKNEQDKQVIVQIENKTKEKKSFTAKYIWNE